MSTVDPNLSPVIVVPGGGSATLPDDPAAVLLDAGAPDTVVTLNSSGVGAARTYAEVVGDGLDAWLEADEENRAGLREALGQRSAVPDTGWTDDITGAATATHSGGVQTLGTDSGGGVRAHRASPATPECPAIEIIGRFDVTTGAPATGWWSGLSLSNSADSYGFVAQVAESAAVALWQANGYGYSLVGSAGSVSLTSGDVWLRLVVTPSYAAAYYGTGSGSTPPTSWTYVTSTNTTAATLAAGYLSRVGLRAGRAASGSGTYTVEWRDVQTRVLGLSP